MSISNEYLIADALRLLGVLAETEGMSAEQGMHGLRTLNQVMADLQQDGVDLQYYEQSSLAEDTPIPDHAILAVKYYLGIALAPFYERSVPPAYVALADKYYSRLKRDAVKERIRPTDLSHLHQGQGWDGNYDIERNV